MPEIARVLIATVYFTVSFAGASVLLAATGILAINGEALAIVSLIGAGVAIGLMRESIEMLRSID